VLVARITSVSWDAVELIRQLIQFHCDILMYIMFYVAFVGASVYVYYLTILSKIMSLNVLITAKPVDFSFASDLAYMIISHH
jgi:hypothetical protein